MMLRARHNPARNQSNQDRECVAYCLPDHDQRVVYPIHLGESTR